MEELLESISGVMGHVLVVQFWTSIPGPRTAARHLPVQPLIFPLTVELAKSSFSTWLAASLGSMPLLSRIPDHPAGNSGESRICNVAGFVWVLDTTEDAFWSSGPSITSKADKMVARATNFAWRAFITARKNP